MTRTWPLALALAACADRGVVIEVDTAGLDVASVELVLSDRTCRLPGGGKCDSIQGQGFAGPITNPVEIFVRGAAARSGQLDGGVARFEIPAGDVTLPMAFAIGRAADERIVGTTVMARTLDLSAGPVIYRARLEPTADLRAGRPTGTAAAAQWGTGDRCVGIEPLTSTLTPRHPVFMVPEDDLDCDGVAPDAECDPLWFEGFTVDEASADHCVTRSSVIAGGPCMLGHVPTCVEVPDPAPSCVELPLRCIPDAVCADCPATDEQCQNASLAKPQLDGRLDCTFPAMADGNGGLGECPSNEFVIEPLGLFSTARCVQGRSGFVQTPDNAIDSNLDTRFTRNGATFEISDVGDDCTTILKWSANLAAVETSHTVLVLGIDVGGQARELWVPVNFTPSVACPADGTPLACTYVPPAVTDDHLIDCLR